MTKQIISTKRENKITILFSVLISMFFVFSYFPIIVSAETPTVVFSADPASVKNGSTTTVNWNISGMNSCVASDGSAGWSGNISAADGLHSWISGPLTTNGDFFYTLSCYGKNGYYYNNRAYVKVSSFASPKLIFSADPVSIFDGGSSNLTWSSTNAAYCVAHGNWSGNKSTSGSESTGPLTTNKTYSLTCIGNGGSVSSSVNLLASPFPGGSGTVADPYRISSWNQLDNIRNYLSSSFILTADLSSTTAGYVGKGDNWNPIGYENNNFLGNFNGNGKIIYDLKINKPSNDYVGLFGFLSGNISNTKLINVDVLGKGRVGGIVGKTLGSISNSSVSGNITGNYDTGGLAGRSDGTISNSYSKGNVTGVSYVGGLVGSHANGSILNSYSKANVISSYNISGGFAGYSYGTISNSYSVGSVNSSSDYVGGFVGYVGNNISNSYSVGKVTGSGNNIGGFAGYEKGGTVKDSFWDKETSGQSTSAGSVVAYSGIGDLNSNKNILATIFDSILNIKAFAAIPVIGEVGKTTAEMRDPATYVGWDIGARNRSIWSIGTDGYLINSDSACVINVGGYDMECPWPSAYSPIVPFPAPFEARFPVGITASDDLESWVSWAGDKYQSGNSACALLSRACQSSRTLNPDITSGYGEASLIPQSCSAISLGGTANCTSNWDLSDLWPAETIVAVNSPRGVTWNGSIINSWYACKWTGLSLTDTTETPVYRDSYPMVAWDANGRLLSNQELYGLSSSQIDGILTITDPRENVLLEGTAICIPSRERRISDPKIKEPPTPELCMDPEAWNWLFPKPCLYDDPEPEPCPEGQYRNEDGDCVDKPTEIDPPPPIIKGPVNQFYDDGPVDWIPPGVIVELNADQSSVCRDGTFNLTWTSQNATGCTVSMVSGSDDSWNGPKPIDGNQSVGPLPVGTYIYEITCVGAPGEGGEAADFDSDEVTITVTSGEVQEINLTANPTEIITINSSSTISWNLGSGASCSDDVEVGSCTGSVSSPAGSGFIDNGWNGQIIDIDGVETSHNTPVFNKNGIYKYSINCMTESGVPVNDYVDIIVNIPPPEVALAVNPDVIDTENRNSTLEWEVKNATECTGGMVLGGSEMNDLTWNGVRQNSADTNGTPHTTQTTNFVDNGVYRYNLTCAGPGGSATSAGDIKVFVRIPPEIFNFDANPSIITSMNEVSDLSFTFRYAEGCYAGNGLGTGYGQDIYTLMGWDDIWELFWKEANPNIPQREFTLATPNTKMFTENGDYGYAVTCSGIGGEAVENTTIQVRIPPSFDFTADRIENNTFVNLSTTPPNNMTVISWDNFKNVGSCTISTTTSNRDIPLEYGEFDSFVCSQATIGDEILYTLSCSGTGGYTGPNTTKSIYVKCPSGDGSGYDTASSFSSSASTISAGETVTLTWTTSDATSGTASGGDSSWPGSLSTKDGIHTWESPPLTSGEYVYSVSYIGEDGKETKLSTTVEVVSNKSTPTIQFVPSSSSIKSGESVTLTWNSSNTSNCSASGDWSGSKATSGSENTGPITSNKTYTLTCVGDGSSANSSVNVSVLSAVQVKVSSAKTISSFKIGEKEASISNLRRIIAISVSPELNIKALTPIIVIPVGATISPASGVTQDFTKPVVYTVTAQDKTKTTYTVSVTQ